MKPVIAWVRRGLEHPWLSIVLAIVAALLCVQSLRLGWILDDYMLRAALTAPEQLSETQRSPAQLFAWSGESFKAPSDFPAWWAAEDYRVSFSRPLSGYTHWLDIELWGDNAKWMHAQSLLWRALVVLAAAFFYRRLAKPDEMWIAGLAALIFALDDVHSLPTQWLANRSSLLALFFGILSLIAHHRWRHDGWRPGAFIAPATLLLALLSGEIAVATGGYLLSYALFLDRGSLKNRLSALLPCATLGVLWLLSYKALGYGAVASGVYIDLVAQPLRFLDALIERGPILLWGQFGFWTPDSFASLSQPALRQTWLESIGQLAVFGLLLIPFLRRHPRARFWAFGLLLAVVPSTGMLPNNRLLVFVSLGAAGLLAIFLSAVWQRAEVTFNRQQPATWWGCGWRWALRLLTVPLLLIHLAQNPKNVWDTTDNLANFNSFVTGVAATWPSDPAVAGQQAIIVNSPGSYLTWYAPSYLALSDRVIPEASMTLSTGIYPVKIYRPDKRTLLIRPEGGFLATPGSVPPGKPLPDTSFNYLLQNLDSAFHDGRPFQVGDRRERGRVSLEITAITEHGRPAEVTFHFDQDLEHTSWRWLRWKDGGFSEWTPPAVGKTVTLPRVW